MFMSYTELYLIFKLYAHYVEVQSTHVLRTHAYATTLTDSSVPD